MSSKYITNKDHAKLYIISDTHLIADELHDNGSAFQRMKDTSAGKDLDYQTISLRAFTRKLIKERPDALIITGDLTFNGELESARKLKAIFAPLKKIGIHLFVTPGNHDIYDGWARSFKNKRQMYTSKISPAKWKELFSDGYKDTKNDDLFYSVNLNPNYHLIFLDSNIYNQNNSSPTTNGRLSAKQLTWLKADLEKACKKKQHSLIFMHHNLYDHNKIINGGFTLDNAEELQKICAEYGITAAFSGHIHAQNIINGNDLCSTPDITSSCFAMTDQGYGVLNLAPDQFSYQRHSFDMNPYLTEKEKAELPNKDFHQYLFNIFKNTNQKQMNWLYKVVTNPTEQTEILNFINKLNWNFFIGKSNYSNKQKEEIKSTHVYNLITEKLPEMKNYLDSLMSVDQDSWKLNIKF